MEKGSHEFQEYFRTETNRRLTSIEQKLDLLFEFKWQIVGWSGAGAFIISVLVAVGVEMIRK